MQRKGPVLIPLATPGDQLGSTGADPARVSVPSKMARAEGDPQDCVASLARNFGRIRVTATSMSRSTKSPPTLPSSGSIEAQLPVLNYPLEIASTTREQRDALKRELLRQHPELAERFAVIRAVE
jgi:hypothetical protein